MTAVEQPLYLVAYLDGWLTNTAYGSGAVSAFGTREEAEAHARDDAAARGVEPSAYRVVRYDFSGEVMEV